MQAREKVSKSERLLNLISYMLRVRRPIPFSDIAGQVVGYDDDAKLDSIEKRFDRDKAELRNMGIPVEYVDTGDLETSGYVIPAEKFFLGKVELNAEDAVVLALAARRSAITHASPKMKEAFESALRKLAVDVPSIDDPPLEPASVLQVSSGLQRVGEHLQIICAALYSRRRITFHYGGSADSEAPRRKIDPYGLGISRGEWYLVGYCHLRKAVRMFKLARISGVVATAGPSDSSDEFEIPADFRIADHLHREAWDFGDGAPELIRVRLRREFAANLLARYANTQVVQDAEPAESAFQILEFSVRGPDRLLDWVLSLGDGAEISGPAIRRLEMVKRLDRMAAAYRDALGD